jgi:ribosome biogenesis GTPase
METGNVSKKTARGKHTTRHVEIFEAEGGGFVFDTPGFTSFEILDAEEDNLSDFYPDLLRFKGRCRFDNCRHIKEPDCKVRDAVDAGEIHPLRYASYLTNMEEIRKRKKY